MIIVTDMMAKRELPGLKAGLLELGAGYISGQSGLIITTQQPASRVHHNTVTEGNV